MFWMIIKRCHFEKFLIGFAICFFASALILMHFESEIHSYGDALWYVFVSCTTIGFGDIVTISHAGRLITVFMTVYEILLVAIMSGIVVSLYLEVVNRRERLTATVFLDKMEHITELDEDELKEIEEKARKISIKDNVW